MRHFIMAGILVLCSGCAAALIGGGLVAGVAIGNDGVTETLDAPIDKVWKKAIGYIESKGKVDKIDKDAGEIEGTLLDPVRYVNIKMWGVVDNRTVIEVRCRKTAKVLPDPEYASKILFYIIKNL